MMIPRSIECNVKTHNVACVLMVRGWKAPYTVLAYHPCYINIPQSSVKNTQLEHVSEHLSGFTLLKY